LMTLNALTYQIGACGRIVAKILKAADVFHSKREINH
jgi:hypothetical protein